MTNIRYPIQERLASRLADWEQNIAWVLRVVRTDAVHGPELMRETLATVQREMQRFMQELDEEENRCERCGAPPTRQGPLNWDDPGRCQVCGATHEGDRRIAVQALPREEDPNDSF